MASLLCSLTASLSRTVWVITALFSLFAFAHEQNKRFLDFDFNLPSSPTSGKEYCVPMSKLCDLPGYQAVGWVKAFQLRSSISILYGCLATLFACTWSILQLNLPGKNDSKSRRFIRKIKWMMIALIFPEFIAGIALAEFWLARESKKAWEKAEVKYWTMTHAYFANMGGFVLELPGQDPFPLNSETLQILVNQELVDVPKIEEKDIEDRSKTDSIARILAMLQVSWMVVQCVGRRSQGLFVTPLEFLAAFCIGISFFTYIFEWLKPKDVFVPITLKPKKVLDDGLAECILATYRRLYTMEELKTTRDMKRIPFGAIMWYLLNDDTDCPTWVNITQLSISCIAGLYNGLHIAVREDLFTPMMYLLWRYSCITATFLIPGAFLLQVFFVKYLPSWLVKRLMVTLCLLYGIARLVPFAVGVMGFGLASSLPIAAYYDVDWASFIPHF